MCAAFGFLTTIGYCEAHGKPDTAACEVVRRVIPASGGPRRYGVNLDLSRGALRLESISRIVRRSHHNARDYDAALNLTSQRNSRKSPSDDSFVFVNGRNNLHRATNRATNQRGAVEDSRPDEPDHWNTINQLHSQSCFHVGVWWGWGGGDFCGSVLQSNDPLTDWVDVL